MVRKLKAGLLLLKDKIIMEFSKFKLSHFIFILPAIILNLIFFLYPLGKVGFMSLHEWPILGDQIFIGIDNYINLFQDEMFWNSLGFTFRYTLMVTPPIFILGFILAMLVKKELPGTTFFRSIYFLPVVISMVSSSLMWLWIYNDLYGILNYYLLRFGIIEQAIVWMGQARTSLPAITFMIVWKMTGFTMVILLAGLQSISEELYEASEVDGASFWQQIRYITLPLLKPTIGLALVISVIGSVLAFEQFLIMTGGGPAQSTTTAVHRIYNISFGHFRLGYGAAMTIILLIILFVLSLLQVKFTSIK